MQASETPARRIAGVNWARNCSVPGFEPGGYDTSHAARSVPDTRAMTKKDSFKKVVSSLERQNFEGAT